MSDFKGTNPLTTLIFLPFFLTFNFFPFSLGHGKFETMGALGISGMLLVTAGGIAWHALDVLLVSLFTFPSVSHI